MREIGSVHSSASALRPQLSLTIQALDALIVKIGGFCDGFDLLPCRDVCGARLREILCAMEEVQKDLAAFRDGTDSLPCSHDLRCDHCRHVAAVRQ